jgi:cellulose synthase/poly-beta-1,6-N-acetylglucosamine synthase-like glycosyltransferase
VETLEESLNSFLKQDYPADRCEMVIVNDYPLQTLKFDHPQVKIYNVSHTFTTIGAKENFATELCKGEIICQWDDDDLAMPWHLKNVVDHLTPDTDIIHWETGVFYNGNAITDITWIGNSGIAFRKSTWTKVGGHPIENAGYDMTFIESLHKNGQRKFVRMDKSKASWFYMWGGRGYHMSGQGHDKPGKPNVIQRHSAHIDNLRQQGKIPTGDVQLKPNWKHNYEKMLKDFVARQAQKS